MGKNDVAYGISAKIVRRGPVKVAEVSITDGVDTWTFDTAESFTVNELQKRFPYFEQDKKIPVLPNQLSLVEGGDEV